MNISLLGPEERPDKLKICESLAQLHQEGAPQDLISHMGNDFLKNFFYPGVLASRSAVTLGLWDGKTLVGFVSATWNWMALLLDLATHQPIRALVYALTCLLMRPKNAVDLAQGLRLTLPKTPDLSAEILMISISPPFRGKRHGQELLQAIHQELSRRGHFFCVARVREENQEAILMYQNEKYLPSGRIEYRGRSWIWMIRNCHEK